MKFVTRKWSDLAPEALKLIKTKLECHNAAINLRLACKKWGEAIEPPCLRLHELLPISFSFNEKISTLTAIRLVPALVVLLRSRHHPYSNWWLVTVEQSTQHKLRLFHPLTKVLPPWDTLIQDDETQVCHPNLDFITLGRVYRFRHLNGYTPVFTNSPESFRVSKMIVWREPSLPSELGGLTELVSEDDVQVPTYTIVRLHNQGNLQCFRISNSMDCNGIYCPVCVEDQCAFDLPKPTKDGFDDAVLWNDVVWAINCQGELFWINYQTLEMKTSVCCTGIPTPRDCGSKRLVVTENGDGSQDLYLVVCTSKCGEFWVYKKSNLCWEKLESLGDFILFVGYDTCFFARTQDVNNIPGNCVIFPVNLYPCYPHKRPRDHDDAVCHGVEDYLDLRVARYGKGNSHMCISEWPGHVSDLFWPPPSTLFKSESGEEDNSGSTSSDPEIANAGTEVIVLD